MNPLRRAHILAQGVAFQVRRRRKAFDIRPEPWIEPEARAFLENALDSGPSYLEFGSGGSTILALRHGCPVVSVESDRYFKAAVESAIRAHPLPSPQRYRLISADIGPTAWYGMPILPLARFYSHRWPRYAQAPWGLYAAGEFPWPQVVLVDGRFRVACTLECMVRIPPEVRFQVLVDDWAGRPEYAGLESLCTLSSRRGRMAVFTRPVDFDYEAAAAALREAYHDPF